MTDLIQRIESAKNADTDIDYEIEREIIGAEAQMHKAPDDVLLA